MSVVCDPDLGTRDYKAIQSLIFDYAGISLSDHKQIMVKGRLARRLRHLELDSYADYVKFLTSGNAGDEVTKFINALTTNKTSFFREQRHFDYLNNKALPEIVAQAKDGRPKKLRIWCSASSTGQEPYSIAMTVQDFFGSDSSWDVRILASDIDTNVLQKAAHGTYADEYVEDIPSDMLHRHFNRIGKRADPQWQAKSDLKDMITFRQINLMEPGWPINTMFDIIFCRNVMIYFNPETQKTLVHRFSEKLQPTGHLIIGHSESLIGLTDDFAPIGDTIYLKKNVAADSRTASRVVTQTTASKQAASKEALKHNAQSSHVLSRNTLSSNASADLASRTGTSPRALSSRTPNGCAKRSFTSTKRQSTKQQATTPASATNTIADINRLLGKTPRHPIIVGEVYASDKPIWVSTLLGSCLAVCMYDEKAGIGGMNHFLIPTATHNSSQASSLGVHAMELLINQIMKLGGERRRLKTKLFGGASVVRNSSSRWNIGERNVDFAEQFLGTENIPVVCSHTGGTSGMHVYFNTQTNKVYVRLLDESASITVQQAATDQSKSVTESYNQSADVTLF